MHDTLPNHVQRAFPKSLLQVHNRNPCWIFHARIFIITSVPKKKAHRTVYTLLQQLLLLVRSSPLWPSPLFHLLFQFDPDSWQQRWQPIAGSILRQLEEDRSTGHCCHFLIFSTIAAKMITDLTYCRSDVPN